MIAPILLLPALLAAPVSPEMCSLEAPFMRRPGDVVVLAVATEEKRWVDPREELPGGFWRLDPSSTPDSVWGQVFQVVEAHRTVELWPGGRFTVVPWGYDPACHIEAWTSRAWVVAGDTVVFSLSPASYGPQRDLFHVYGWQQPYPTGRLTGSAYGGDRKAPWITACQFYDLWRIVPGEEVWESDPGSGWAGIRDWARERGLTDHFPVAPLLNRWRRMAEHAAGVPPS